MALTEKQAAEIQALLSKRETLLNEDVVRQREDREDLQQAAVEVPDSGDQATADTFATLNQAELNRDMLELTEIAAARVRLADGSYGRCADCGTDIPLERLQVQPTALRCTACQALREKTFAQESGDAP